MSRTIRKVNSSTARWAKEMDDKRKAKMLLKGAKHFRSDKCSEATTDAEGNFKLNTWTECPSKTGRLANRSIRNTAKVQIRRQLDDIG